MAIGRRTHSKSAGFSLIELLVVVTIIGLLAGAVTLSVVRADAGQRSAADMAASLHSVFLHASVEAVMRGEVLAAQLMPPTDTANEGWHLQWLRWGESGWQAAPAGRGVALADLMLPRGLEPEIRPGREGSAGQIMAAGPVSDPVVVFYTTGDISPFELLLNDRTSTDRTAIAALGNTLNGYLEVRQ